MLLQFTLTYEEAEVFKKSAIGISLTFEDDPDGVCDSEADV